MKELKPDLLSLVFDDEDSLTNLRSTLSRNVRGNSADYRTPFWDGDDPMSILHKWQDKLHKLLDPSVMPGLLQFEDELAQKVGPLSIMAPFEERREDVISYFESVLKKSVPLDERAVQLTIAEMKSACGVRLMDPHNVMNDMKMSTSAGLPYSLKKRFVRGLIINDANLTAQLPYLQRGYLHYSQPYSAEFPITAVLGWRGQEGGPSDDDVKQRVVWMMPFLLNVLEGMFYKPAITAWQSNNINPAYISQNAVEEAVTRLFRTKNPSDLVVATDFSKFDQHFNSSLQQAARKVIKGLMTTSKACNYWLDYVFPTKYILPILCTENSIFHGNHGMGSGSNGTNFDECCAHRSLQHESAVQHNSLLNPNSLVLGDDGCLSYDNITVEKVVSTYTRHGLDMNPSKQYADAHSTTYLRRYYHDSYVDSNGKMLGVYSTCRALGRLMYQERFYRPEFWSEKMVTLRALSILENCNSHPLFHQFIDFVMSGDRYRLGLAIPHFYESLSKLAHEAEEHIPDFFGYTKTLHVDSPATGINDWEVVKYMKSKL